MAADSAAAGRWDREEPSGTPGPPRRESVPGYQGWRVAFAAGVGVFFASLIVVTFPVFLKPWSAEFSWSRQQVSAAFAIAALVAGICAGPLGILVSRVGVRPIAVPSLAALGLLFGSIAFLTPSLAHLYLLFAALGVAGIGTSPVAYARAISTWFDARRGMALAVVITGGALGGVLHPPIVTALIGLVGWRGACLTLGAAVVSIGLPIVWALVRDRPAGAALDGSDREGEPMASAMRSPVFWALAAALFCGTLVQNAVIVHLPALLTDRGSTITQSAVALSAMALAAVAGRLATGYWIDRVFAARALLVLMALAGAGAFLLSGAGAWETGLAAAVLVGFATGGEADVVPYLLSRYFGLRSLSALYGFAWLANAMGGALGPVLMGRAFDREGSYEGALVRLALVSLAAAALALALPRYRFSAAPR